MASDRYGSARWAEAKDLKAEGVMTIPAARVARGDGDTEENRAFLLGCDADPAELTKDMRQGYSEMLGAISDGTANIVRKVAGGTSWPCFSWMGGGWSYSHRCTYEVRQRRWACHPEPLALSWFNYCN